MLLIESQYVIHLLFHWLSYQILTKGGSSWRSGFGCWMVGACWAKAFSKSSIIKCLRFFTIFSNGAAPKHLNDEPSLPKNNYTPVMVFVWWHVSIHFSCYQWKFADFAKPEYLASFRELAAVWDWPLNDKLF